MKNKIVIFLLTFVVFSSGSIAFAEENTNNTPEMEVQYTASSVPSVDKFDKGPAIQKPTLPTGDTTVTIVLETLVSIALFVFIFILYFKKRGRTYEEN